MPLGNLKLLVRPNPGGLADHKRFLAEEARQLGRSGKFSDFVMISEEGQHVYCHLSFIVPLSPFLRSAIPSNFAEAQQCQLSVPVSIQTLESLMELLYTGETQASHSELEKIKVGLNLLGILHPGQGHQPDQPAVTCAPVPEVSPSPLAEGVINSSQAAVAASAVNLSMTVRPKVETVELFPRTEQTDGSNVITLQRLEQEDSDRSPPNDTINSNNNLSNNNVKDDEKDTETRARRKRKRILSYRDHDEEEEELQSTVKLEKTAESEEILVEGYPITQEVECCQDCGASLASEWHRPPNRHDCQTMAVTTCQHCGVTVRGSWYLPPSRHHCQGYSPNTPPAQHGKRRRQFGSPSRAVREYHDFSCPLEDCARQCDSKKLLMLHLAIGHYMPELEELYINGVCSDGGRVCPHCGDLQPGIKLNFIRHLAMEHEVVMELLERDLLHINTDDEDFSE